MLKCIVFLLMLLSVVACDDRYKATNYYDTSGIYLVRAGKEGFEFNNYSLFIRANPETIKSDHQITFIISGLSRNSEPNVILYLDQAKLVIGDQVINPINGEITNVVGVVNPKNGECLFNEYTVRFTYPPKLHWGEKINNDAIKQDLMQNNNFYISFPASIPQFDPRPIFESEKSPMQPKVHNVVFKFSQRIEPGEKFIKFGSW